MHDTNTLITQVTLITWLHWTQSLCTAMHYLHTCSLSGVLSCCHGDGEEDKKMLASSMSLVALTALIGSREPRLWAERGWAVIVPCALCALVLAHARTLHSSMPIHSLAHAYAPLSGTCSALAYAPCASASPLWQ